MKLKRLFVLVFVLVFAIVLVGCKKTTEDTYEIAVVTDVGQLMDGGFNQGTYEGAVAYATANNKTYKYYQPANGSDATDNDRIAAMRQAIENGAKVIVTPGYLQYTALATVAAESPDVKFIFIDGWAIGKANVTAVAFKEEQSGFFAGYAAVMDGYTKLGGTFGGGGTNAACNRFAYGYVQGINAAAKALNKTVDATISFKFGSTFSHSNELKTQVAGWYAAGTEVVFSCGGSMLQSVKAAAVENAGKKIIGVDVDQSGESTAVITSAVKGLAAAVELTLTSYYAGEWDAKLADKCSNLGAAENATGLPTATASWRFTTFTVAQYNTLFESVKAGTVTVDSTTPAAMDDATVWATINETLTNVNITFEASAN